MNRRDRLAVLALLALLAVVGAAMLVPGGGPAETPGSPPPPAITAHEAVVGRPSSINPLTARTQADRDLVALLFRGLVKAAPDGSIAPDLARDWNVSSDGKTYTFYLVGDARWEDGQPVTATDVVFTVDLASDPDYQGPLGASWQGVDAKAVSAHVVQITLPVPLGGFLRQATLAILPSHVLNGVGVADLADSDFSARPMGDGPFRLLEIDVSHALLARSTPATPAGSAGSGSASATSSIARTVAAGGTSTAGASAATATPAAAGSIAAIELLFYDDQASAAAAYLAGTADAVGGLTPDNLAAASKRSGSRIVRYPWASLTSVVLNQRSAHPEFGTLSVRRALLAAIDRPAVLTRILLNRGSVADAPLPSWSAWYDPAAVSTVPYAGAGAASGLADAGWVHGQDGWMLPGATKAYVIRLLTLDEASDPTSYRVAQQVASDWRDMGLQVSLVPVSVKDYRQSLQTGQFDAAVVEYALGLDPDVSALLLSTQAAPAGSNLSGVSDQTLDRLLQTVRTTVDSAARKAAVSALERYVSANLLMLPICFSDYAFVVSERLSGPTGGQIADPSGRHWDVLDWRLAGAG